MKFDFIQQYNTYSNSELLKIVTKPADYQPEAVAAAKSILSEREISDDDFLLVDEYFEQRKLREKITTERLQGYKSKAEKTIRAFIEASGDSDPKTSIKYFIILISLLYGWYFLKSLGQLYSFLQCRDCGIDIVHVLQFSTLAYIPVIIYLILRRKRWGWILLFTNGVFLSIASLVDCYFFFKYRQFYPESIGFLLFSVVLKFGLTIFLWRKDTAEYFGAIDTTKADTAIFGTLGSIFLQTLIFMIS